VDRPVEILHAAATVGECADCVVEFVVRTECHDALIWRGFGVQRGGACDQAILSQQTFGKNLIQRGFPAFDNHREQFWSDDGNDQASLDLGQ